MTYRRYFICLVLSMLVSISTAVFAGDPPNKLNYQGILTNGSGQPITGLVNITFRLYDVLTGGTEKWSEQQSVTLSNDGRFSVVLGSSTPLNPGLFTGVTYIGVKVGSDAEMPRQQLTSVAYALNASTATTAITAQKSLDTVQIPKGVIVMWSGSLETIPSGWALCDGNNGTPNLKDRFVLGAGGIFPSSGGSSTHTHSLPDHNHSIAADGQHSHHIDVEFYNCIGDCIDGADGSGKDVGSDSHGHHLITDTWGAGQHSHGGWTGSKSGGDASGSTNHLPPYFALAYIMKL